MNKVTLIGNVGQDPETTHMDNTQVSKFSLATSESYKNKSGEKVTDTDWHRVEVWGGLSKVVEQYVKKGDKIAIEGKVKYGTYENKEGLTVHTTTIRANEMEMLGSRNNAESSVNQEPSVKSDLPF